MTKKAFAEAYRAPLKKVHLVSGSSPLTSKQFRLELTAHSSDTASLNHVLVSRFNRDVQRTSSTSA